MRTPFSVPSARRGSFDSLIGCEDDVQAAAAATSRRSRAFLFTMASTIALFGAEGVAESPTLSPLGNVDSGALVVPAPMHRNRVQEHGIARADPLVEEVVRQRHGRRRLGLLI